MGAKTKIDWADSTWNPVTGCLHGCEYCYARGIANRFAGVSKSLSSYGVTPVENGFIYYVHVAKKRSKDGHPMEAPYPFGFAPTFHQSKLDEPQKWKNPRTIFVCSMADLFGDWVPDKWIQDVFDACQKASQHRYLFLTKNPSRYCKIANAGWLPDSKNFWYGSTITHTGASFFSGSIHWNTFISAEPLLEPLDVGIGSFGGAKWIILGAETGNRKGKIVPKRDWIENILDAASTTGVKVYMKESIRELMEDDFCQEYPWENHFEWRGPCKENGCDGSANRSCVCYQDKHDSN